MDTSTKNNLAIPLAIIVAGALIAGALYMGNRADRTAASPLPEEQSGSLDDMRPVSSDDHIRGNPKASVKIVEYSDMECPFCKGFHSTMQHVAEEYGDKVAWVYRHFPLDQLHPVKARKEAIAAECAAELGGNDAFWSYVDRFFELTPSNNQTDVDTVLPQIAKELGLDEAKFSSCLASGKFDAHIEDDMKNAAATGGNGTPWSIVVSKSGKKYPLSGAQPYAAVKQLVELALKDK